MRIPYGGWEPDSSAVDARDQSGRVIMKDAKGVYPAKTGYVPVPSLQDFGSLAGGNDAYTKVLLHFEGSDGATTFTDDNIGGSSHTWTAAGNAQIDTAQFKFGTSSGLFDGTGDYITTPDHADYSLGSSDFTVDGWFNCVAAGGSFVAIVGHTGAAGTTADTSFWIDRSNTNVITAGISDGSSFFTIFGTTQFTNALNTGWHHVAFVRTGNTLKLFIDGTQEGGNLSFSGTVNNSSGSLSVGRYGDQVGFGWNGWIDEFRLSVGTARWTTTFTPPTSAFSAATLPAAAAGVFVGHATAGGHVLFAGTRSRLYKYDDTLGWINYTRTSGGNYTVPSDDYWSFTQFGSKVIAVNINDAPQVIDIDTGAVNFSALGGSPPNSRYVAVVGDFVVLACQSAAPRTVVNSAINDATGWTIGTNLCDEQEFADGERITGIAGGEYGWIVQEHAIRRMIFQPGFDQAFRFERVERERGCATGYGLIAVKDTIYFPAADGFYAFRDSLVPIGHQRINGWFNDNSDTVRFFSVLGFTDPFGPRVYWAFFNSASSTTLDRLLIYDWSLDQWSYTTQAAQYWGQTVTSGTTLEGLNVYGSIDGGSIPYPLDSRVWEGGLPVIVAISTAGKLAFLNGATPVDATLLTAPMQLTPSARSFIRDAYPIGLFNGATQAMRVGRREHGGTAASYGSSLSPSTRAGTFRAHRTGRLHEFEHTITQSSGTTWEHAEGLDITAAPDGLQG